MSLGNSGRHVLPVWKELEELQELLLGWMRFGVLLAGVVEWDREEGVHKVSFTSSKGTERTLTGDEFRAYCLGISDMARHFSGEGE